MLSSKERAALAAIGRFLEREDPRLARQLTADPREVPGAVEPSPGRAAPAAPVPDAGPGAGAPAPAVDGGAGGTGSTGGAEGTGETGEEDDEPEPPSPAPEIAAIAVLAVMSAIGLLVGLVAGRPVYALVGAALGAVGGFWCRSLRRVGRGG
ncbi:DUF3040 domain-containing protein [Pseudonocardia sp. RS11V-5]|uniref:DUF3040 domain-containing protein n=1 Tax=Pseudonocardia terrae TaxID=2905831 RepID=UPI001E53C44B|nr:DUF3040 domain-containing protein [Pseudonocardia terrae]MCE3553095.1 DUF3040 domain-containing protein [Pseudonocardia terrae]